MKTRFFKGFRRNFDYLFSDIRTYFIFPSSVGLFMNEHNQYVKSNKNIIDTWIFLILFLSSEK